eukprot:6179619-Alexandrium_andersonii.AAC.1
MAQMNASTPVVRVPRHGTRGAKHMRLTRAAGARAQTPERGEILNENPNRGGQRGARVRTAMAEAVRQRGAARCSWRQCKLSGRGAERNDVRRTSAGPGNEKPRGALRSTTPSGNGNT